MELNSIKKPKGVNKKNKKVGRGIGSGHGKTSCRGHKGQGARSGYSSKPYWEGGQMPLYRVLAKSGFKNIFKKEYEILNLGDLEKLNMEKIDISILREKKIVPKYAKRIKLLAKGKLTKAVEVNVHKASKKAIKAIEDLKGKVTIIPEVKFVREKKKK